jgi:hypothetical protein
VLDFGLAKALEVERHWDGANPPTLTVANTAAGVILGIAVT